MGRRLLYRHLPRVALHVLSLCINTMIRGSAAAITLTIRCFLTGRGLTLPVPAFAFNTNAGFIAPFVFTVTPPGPAPSVCGIAESSLSRLGILRGSAGAPAPGVGAGVAGVCCTCAANGGCDALDTDLGAPAPGGTCSCGRLVFAACPGGGIGGRAVDGTGRGVPVRTGAACCPHAEGVPTAAADVGVAGGPEGPGVPTPRGSPPCAFANFLSSF